MPDQPELDLSKPNIQMLFQDLAQTRRDLQNEYRESARKVQDERERSRFAIERYQKEFAEKVRSVEKENEALARALGRLQNEVDRLREENAILKISHRHDLPSVDKVDRQPGETLSAYSEGGPVNPVQTPSLAVLPKVVVVPSSEPTLGKSVPITS